MPSLNNSSGIIAQTNAPLDTYTQLATFSPTISGATTAGVGTYTVQAGFYYVVGNIVFVNINLTWTAHTGTGNMLLSSLPFICINQSGFTPTFSVRTENISLPSNSINVLGEVQLNTTRTTLYATRNNAGALSLSMSAAGTIRTTFIYETV